MSFKKTNRCTICNKLFDGWGNNAFPVTDGVCCNECNKQVVTCRILADKYLLNPVNIAQLCKAITCEPKIGNHLFILEMSGEQEYQFKCGIITAIDDAKQIHGTWGGCAIIPNKDVFYTWEH